MASNPKDVYRKFSKNDVFVVGTTSEERVKILYIRSGMSPSIIYKRLKKWGDEIPLTRIRNWIAKGDWRKEREKFKQTYSTTIVEQRAVAAAVKDVSDEQQVREVYSEVSGQMINSIKQKLALATTPDSPIPTLDVQELASLAMSLDITQKVHFKSLGIPELIRIDPTSGFEGIRIIPAHEDPDIDSSDEK